MKKKNNFIDRYVRSRIAWVLFVFVVYYVYLYNMMRESYEYYYLDVFASILLTAPGLGMGLTTYFALLPNISFDAVASVGRFLSFVLWGFFIWFLVKLKTLKRTTLIRLSLVIILLMIILMYGCVPMVDMLNSI